jgi:nitrogen fixation NifU-like protein
MDDLYRQNILDHYRNPRNKGTLPEPSYSHQEDNPLCGDTVRIDLHVSQDDVIDRIVFDGEGCAISMASASMLTETLKGKPLDEARHLSKQDVLDTLGVNLNASRMKCALLPFKALKMAIGDSDACASGPDDDDEDW